MVDGGSVGMGFIDELELFCCCIASHSGEPHSKTPHHRQTIYGRERAGQGKEWNLLSLKVLYSFLFINNSIHPRKLRRKYNLMAISVFLHSLCLSLQKCGAISNNKMRLYSINICLSQWFPSMMVMVNGRDKLCLHVLRSGIAGWMFLESVSCHVP